MKEVEICSGKQLQGRASELQQAGVQQILLQDICFSGPADRFCRSSKYFLQGRAEVVAGVVAGGLCRYVINPGRDRTGEGKPERDGRSPPQ